MSLFQIKTELQYLHLQQRDQRPHLNHQTKTEGTREKEAEKVDVSGDEEENSVDLKIYLELSVVLSSKFYSEF